METRESLNVGLSRRMIEKEIADVVSDLQFLARHTEKIEANSTASHLRSLQVADVFKTFAQNKGYYDQIRYLDKSGRERVRVNYNGGDVRVVAEEELQNKSNRYYFKDALSLEAGGIYLSRFDLNMENDSIESPLKPVIRFGTPVTDQGFTKRGVIILNYLGARLIEGFIRAAANIDDHIELLDFQGYWLSSLKHDNEWGFMLGHESRYQNDFPAEWRIISVGESGHFLTENGLFTFSTVKPHQSALISSGSNPPTNPKDLAENSEWKIVSRIPVGELSSTLSLFLQTHFALYFSMFLLLSGGTWLLSQSQQQHRATEAQRDYEKRFRHTLENIDLVAVALNRSGQISFCNDCFLKLVGWRREDVIGRNWFDDFASIDNGNSRSISLKSLLDADSTLQKYESKVKTSDGLRRLMSWNNTLSYDTEGTVIGITAIGEDITDQRKTEIELRKLSAAVEQSPSTVMITDCDGMIEYVNPKFSRVSGYASHEVLGKNPRLLKSGETSVGEYKDLWNNVLQGSEWRGEFHNKRKNGELYWESAVISAIRDSDGKVTNFLAVKEDISERKRLEEEVEQQNKELAYAETMAAMGRMASMVAHDLRNPLSSVKMTLQILGKQKFADNETSNQVTELMQMSLEQIRYMEDILSDMLSFSRPNELRPAWITVDKVIDMAVSISQRRIDENGVQLSTSYRSGLPTIYADATGLRQVFSNLISNAAQATKNCEERKVNVEAMLELGCSGTAVRVDICDTGIGVNAKDTEKIFEPYYTTRAKGTGLGLAIVKRIVSQHDGTISVSKNESKGTCVTVVIPVSPRTDQTFGHHIEREEV